MTDDNGGISKRLEEVQSKMDKFEKALTAIMTLVTKETVAEPKAKKPRKPSTKKTSKAKKKKVVETPVPLVPIVQKRIGNASSPIGQLKAPCFPFEKITSEATKEINDQLYQGEKALRSEYVPNMVKCQYCSKMFDYHKEYPAGHLAGNNSVKCNKCKGKFS